MPAHETTIAGAPVWVDLSSTNTAQSIEFYESLLGWTHSTGDEATGGYVTFLKNGAPVAGMVGMANESGSPDAWTTYLLTDDAEATASAVVASGGKVLFKDRVGDLGTMLIIIDAAGSMVGGWQKGVQRGFTLANEPGTVAWNELHTSHFAAAVDFYTSAFDWSTSVMSDTDEFRMSTFGVGQDAVAGIYDATNYAPSGDTHWEVYFAVEDADDAAARILALGGELIDQPTDTPFGRMAHARDSTGAPFTFIRRPGF
jgi:uncharacterized protein